MPPAWFLAAVVELGARVFENTGAEQEFRITVDHDLGLLLGLAPGEWMTVMTMSGPVHVSSRP